MTPSASGTARSWPSQPEQSEAHPTEMQPTEMQAAESEPAYPWSAAPPGAQDDADLLDERPPESDLRWLDEAAEGLSGRGVITLGGAAAAVCVIVDLLLTGGRLTFFFDLCFVVICLVSTMAVRRRELFTAGVLPPLLYAAVIAVLSIAAPHAFQSAPGAEKVFLTGLANHVVGLLAGYGVALGTVAARIAATSSAPGARRT